MGWSAARAKAEKKLKDAQENGLDRIIWDIEVDAKAPIPPGKIIEDYISDSVWNGIHYEDGNAIYVELDYVALEFSKDLGNLDTVTEHVVFFPGVVGDVEVRYQHLDMEYLGEIDINDVPNKRAKRPYKVNITVT